jgi:hypothetical protein
MRRSIVAVMLLVACAKSFEREPEVPVDLSGAGGASAGQAGGAGGMGGMGGAGGMSGAGGMGGSGGMSGTNAGQAGDVGGIGGMGGSGGSGGAAGMSCSGGIDICVLCSAELAPCIPTIPGTGCCKTDNRCGFHLMPTDPCR